MERELQVIRKVFKKKKKKKKKKSVVSHVCGEGNEAQGIFRALNNSV